MRREFVLNTIQLVASRKVKIAQFLRMQLNINVGLLGHVDSGKTTLSKALSKVSSTAAFDKNPQSQERGITLDLGFSGLTLEAPESFKEKFGCDSLVFTFVDCPGHQSLIKTIIGGSQIIGKSCLSSIIFNLTQTLFSFRHDDTGR
jgi:translation initiation factor 2 gamma subunit (eIF-2gamma)